MIAQEPSLSETAPSFSAITAVFTHLEFYAQLPDGLSPDHRADKEEERKSLLGAYSAFIPQQNILFRAAMNLPWAEGFIVGFDSQG